MRNVHQWEEMARGLPEHLGMDLFELCGLCHGSMTHSNGGALSDDDLRAAKRFLMWRTTEGWSPFSEHWGYYESTVWAVCNATIAEISRHLEDVERES